MLNGREKIHTKFYLELNDIFLPGLKLIDLPVGVFPSGVNDIVFDEQTIIPLLSLEPILLDYFTPKELVNLLQFQSHT